MIRIILSSLAVVAMFATSAAPAASQAKMTGQQPVPCDCSNCSAKHCPKPGGVGGPIGKIIGGFKSVTYLKSTLERHLASGGSKSALPPTDCPPAPTQQCLDSWKVKTANPFE